MQSNIFSADAQELRDKNISVAACTDWSLSMKLRQEQGAGFMQLFQLLPELILCFNDFQTKSCPKFGLEANHSNRVLINYCFTGRCEVELENGMFIFLGPQDLVISTRWTKREFSFPVRAYTGIEFIIDLDQINEASKIFWGQIGFDLRELKDMFCRDTGYFIGHDHGRLEQLLRSMKRDLPRPERPLLLIKTAEFLFELSKGHFTPENGQRKYYSKSQVRIAREVEDEITGQLNRHLTTEKLARKYGISPTSLQNYFKGIYGEPISVYLRKARMNTAAKLLKHSRKKVSEIASCVGYENQSKFAAAFKEVLLCNPLEYRQRNFGGDDSREEAE